MPGDVELEAADAQDSASRLAAQKGADSRLQLLEVERLDEVVVRAVVEAADPVGDAVARRRRGIAGQARLAVAAQAAADVRPSRPGMFRSRQTRS